MQTKTPISTFRKTVWRYYETGRRAMPWRLPEPDGSFDPYKILVSEIMLQQTQVTRVIPKFTEFVELYPTAGALADAPLGCVLSAWSGLGYNRRAKYLHTTVQRVRRDSGGVIPLVIEDLVTLPGVGMNTAAAIYVYSTNRPAVFIETNIRTIFMYHFFQGHTQVKDKDILPLIERTQDQDNPREWYWALMDYGSYLKHTIGSNNHASSHYRQQKSFHGSVRQLRGQVLRALINSERTLAQIEELCVGDARLAAVLDALIVEGMIIKKRGLYSLPD